MSHQFHFTNVCHLPGAVRAQLQTLLDVCVGQRVTNENRTLCAEVQLVECGARLRGLLSVVRDGVELFVPGSDAVLRVPFTGISDLKVYLEG